MTAPAATDWVLRPFVATRVHPVWVGLGLAVVAFAINLAFRLAIGGDVLRFVAVDAVTSLLIGYLPASSAWLRLSMVRDFEGLRRVLRGGEGRVEALLASAICPGRRALLVGGVAGAVLASLMPVLDPDFWPDGRPDFTAPIFVFLTLRQCVIGFLVGRAGVAEWVSISAYARIGASAVEVDLLDPSPLRIFAWRGLRSGFVWLAGASLVSLFWLGPAPSTANGPIIGVIWLATVIAFVACMSGVHDSIRRVKAERLAGIRERIRRESDALLAGSPGGERLASLIALQDLVERVHEWPFDAPLVLRFALLALLGLGSWLGAALVERLLDTALG